MSDAWRDRLVHPVRSYQERAESTGEEFGPRDAGAAVRAEDLCVSGVAGMHGKAVNASELGIEVLDLLWSMHLLRHHTVGSADPIEAMRSLKILQLLSDDIVLRLCKLLDSDPRSVSFHQVLGVTR